MKYADTWDLETVFPGGTQSPVLQEKVKAVPSEMKAYEKTLSTSDNEGEMPLETFITLLHQRETIGKGLGQSSTFIKIWHDAYMHNEHANIVMGQVMEIKSLPQSGRL